MQSSPSNDIDDDATPTQKASNVTGRRRQSYREFGKYALWQIAGNAIGMGSDRLIVAPILNARLGESPFGALIWARDCFQLASAVATNGFRLQLSRQYVHLSPEESSQRTRTAVLLTLVTSVTSMLIVSLFVSAYIPGNDAIWSGYLLLALSLLGVVRSLESLLTLAQVVRLQYRAVFFLRLVEGLLLLLSLGFITQQLGLIATFYAVAALVPLFMTAWYIRDMLRGGHWWDPATASQLCSNMWAGVSIALIEQLLLYGPRLALGIWAEGAEVTTLYAATTIAGVFLMPVSLLGSILQNYLASRKVLNLGGPAGREVLQITFMLAVVIALLAYAVGWIVIPILYPNVADAALKLYPWIVASTGMIVVRSILRPIAVRFASMRTVVGLSSVTLVIQFTSLAVLVPWLKSEGAALSMCVSSFAAMAVWLATFRGLRRDQSQSMNHADVN